MTGFRLTFLIAIGLYAFPALAETTRVVVCPPNADRCYYQEKPVVPVPNLDTLIRKWMSICLTMKPLPTVVTEAGKTVKLPSGYDTAPDYEDVINHRKPYRKNKNGYCYQEVYYLALYDFCGGADKTKYNDQFDRICKDDFLARALVKDPAFFLHKKYIDTLLGRR